MTKPLLLECPISSRSGHFARHQLAEIVQLHCVVPSFLYP
jgi:hypothetical protein